MIRATMTSVAIWALLLASAYAVGLRIAPRPTFHPTASACIVGPTLARTRTL